MKIETVCENRAFLRAYSKGKKHAGKYAVLYVTKNGSGKTRVGLTVTKSRGGAVMRNRIKRVLRCAVAENMKDASFHHSGDIIIVARDACAFAKSDVVARDMRYGFIRLGVISENDAQTENNRL